MALTPAQQKWLDWFAVQAVNAERTLGYWSELIIASAALESGWGQKSIKEGNNVFGITYNPHLHRDFVWVPTLENITYQQLHGFAPDERETAVIHPPNPWEGKRSVSMKRKFAKFESVLEAIDAYILLIKNNPRYHFSEATGWEDMARKLEIGGYATAAGYSDLLVSIGNSMPVKEALFNGWAQVKEPS